MDLCDNKNKGITLISLVITIIILLILAAVTIGTLTGENGLIARAQEARDKTEQSSNDELTKIAALEALTHLEDYDYTDKDGKKIKIPKGFAVSSVEGEKSEAEGLVIVDAKENEFVWIPCESKDFVRETSWTSYAYNDKTWTDAGDTNIKEKIKAQEDNNRRSGTTYSTGFYVARYEAGIPEEMIGAYVNTDGGTYAGTGQKNKKEYIPVSKKGVQAWSCITQENAEIVAAAMVPGRSQLISGVAWDTVCKKIASTKSITNSRDWGNYYNTPTEKYSKINTLYAKHDYNNRWTLATTYQKGLVKDKAPGGSGTTRLELATGSSDEFKAYNVYDIAGNMWEWTTEKTGPSPSDDYAVRRGGSFDSHGGDNPASRSNGDYRIGATSVNVGFRVVLYM